MKKTLIIIFTIVFIDMLGIGILIPVLPQFLGNPESAYYLLGPNQISFGFILFGFMVALYPIGQFIATPILGQLSDRYGRKPILIISIIGTSLGYFLFALGIYTRNLPLMFFSRFLDGLTGGNVSVAQASLADITKPEQRSKYFGIMGGIFGLGFIIGPYLGGLLTQKDLVSWFSPVTPFLFAGLFSFISLFFVIFLFKETNKNIKNTINLNFLESFQNIKKAYKIPQLSIMFKTSFFYQMGFTFFTSFFNIYMISRFFITEHQIGLFFAYLGIFIAFNQGFVTGYMLKYFNEKQILSYSLISTGFILMLYFLPTEFRQIFWITPFFAIPTSLSMAILTGYVSKMADKEIQGEVLGINASVYALAQSIPAILSGFIAAFIAPWAPILVGGLFLIISGIYFVSNKNRLL